MSKYQPLSDFLNASSAHHLPLTFGEVEAILGAKLPTSAYEHPAWWANDAGKSHVQAKAWLLAGYETEQIDKQAKSLVFKRVARAPGMTEAVRDFAYADLSEKRLGRHPAFGSMTGTFTIEPGYDLTSPMYTDEEWVEIEKEMDADWDQIEQGMTKNK